MKRLALAILAAILTTGCNVAGFLGYAATGDKPIPAKFTPPKEPTLVLVENERAAASAFADCDHITAYIEQDLKAHDVAPLVSPDKLTELRMRDPVAYRSMSIVALAHVAGAKQVIYVSLSDYDADTAAGSDVSQWRAQAKVRVVDAATGMNKWPIDLADGEPLKAHTQLTPTMATTNANGTTSDAHDDLDKDLGLQVGKLFHPWVQEDADAEEIRRD